MGPYLLAIRSVSKLEDQKLKKKVMSHLDKITNIMRQMTKITEGNTELKDYALNEKMIKIKAS